MSNLRNIGGDQGDKFFRYKMPDIQSKIEKPNTNGQQTIVLNIAEIAKALKCDPEYPTRFWGIELGAGATFQDNSDRTCAILKGMFPPNELLKTLEKFITMFILCPNCKLPETRLSVKKKQVSARCASCGFEGPLNHGHRLEKWMVNRHAINKKAGKGKKGKKSKKDREAEETAEESKQGELQDSEHGLFKKSDRDEISNKMKKKKKDKDENVKFAVDTSEAAQEKRLKAMLETEFAEEKKRVKVGKVDTSKPEQVLRAFMLTKDREVHEVVSELSRLSMGHEMSLQEKWRVVFEGLLDSKKPKSFSKQIKKNAKIFKALADSPTNQLCVIKSSMRFLQVEMMERLPILLQTFYEKDILEDTAITSWYHSPPESDGDAVGKDAALLGRKTAKVFIDWLEASDDDEESSGSDDE